MGLATPAQDHANERPSEADPFRELHLQSTAPQELVVKVYWHIVDQLLKGSGDDPGLRTRLPRLNEAYSRILVRKTGPILEGRNEQGTGGASVKMSWLPFRSPKQRSRQQSPWDLLHIDPGAPPDVVDLAYLFWRMRHRSQRRESAGATLDELQGAYEALRQDSSPAGPAEGGASPVLKESAPEPSGGAEREADNEVASQLDAGALRENEAVSAQGRGPPVVSGLDRRAKRASGVEGRTESVSVARDGFLDAWLSRMGTWVPGDSSFHELESQPRIHIVGHVLAEVQRHSESDLQNEVGGFLLGHDDQPEGREGIDVYITASLRATNVNTGPTRIEFTHDTWLAFHEEREQKYPGRQVVGWYHTHPNVGVFLSSYDAFIHRGYFNGPSKVALVIDPVRKDAGFFKWVDNELDTHRPYGWHGHEKSGPQ